MSEQAKVNKEQLILETAERIFMEKGYAMTSTVEIAKEAGCNQAMVHYYFRSKEQLFSMIFQKKISYFVKVLYSAIDTPSSFEEHIKSLTGRHFDLLCEDENLPLFITRELADNPERLKEVLPNIHGEPLLVMKRFREECEKAMQRGEIRKVGITDIMYTIISLNAAAFIGKNILKAVLGLDESGWKEYLSRRREENITSVYNSIKI